MKTFSTEAICAITGSHPACIRRWSKAGLITIQHAQAGWKSDQIVDIYRVVNLVASGATLKEIRHWQIAGKQTFTPGWPAHRGELLWQLEYGSDRSLARAMRQIDHDYCGDDYIYRVLRPLNKWLREDNRPGAQNRLTRFHAAVLHRAHCVMRHAKRNNMVPVFLEAISVSDETDVWLEAIRLTRQGFKVELANPATDKPDMAGLPYEHHLLWCATGISSSHHSAFLKKLDAGEPIRLCGPDTRITLS